LTETTSDLLLKRRDTLLDVLDLCLNVWGTLQTILRRLFLKDMQPLSKYLDERAEMFGFLGAHASSS
jgi:hypothetical protein